MKKKLLTLLLALAMALSLASCGGDVEPVADAPAPAQEETTPAAPAAEENTPAAPAAEPSPAPAPAENAVVDIESKRGGLDMGTAEGGLDANPTRAVRRSTTPIEQVRIAKLDGSLVPEDFYLYRSTWDESGKRAYDQICQGLTNGESTIVMSTPMKQSNASKIYFSVCYDHPELFWVSSSFNYSYNNNGIVTEVRPKYYTSDISGMKAKVDASVNGALADMWSLGSDVERVKYAHDFLCDHITYTHNDMDQTAYSGFAMGQSVCAGYAKCMTYMLHKMGIPSTVVVGDAGGNHAWNLLQLGGDYYVMDVTWDDPDNGGYSYNYFDITDSQISKDHTRGQSDGFDISCYLPIAYGTAMSYQNAFGGNAYGTDYGAINGTMPSASGSGSTPADNTPAPASNEGSGWWNLLDDNWSKDDWEYDGDSELWVIYDEESDAYYFYDEDSDNFACMSAEKGDDTVYQLNKDTGEWEAQ